MKHFHKFLIFCFFFLYIHQSIAQIGPIAGYNVSCTPNYELGPGVRTRIKNGFHAGIISEIVLYKDFILQTGIMYTTKGTKRSILGDYWVSVKGGFIDIPVNFKYRFNGKIVKPSIFTGPFFSFGISGNYISHYNFGISAGVSIEVKNCLMSIQIGNIGFIKIESKVSAYGDLNFRVLSVSMAYLFKTKK